MPHRPYELLMSPRERRRRFRWPSLVSWLELRIW